MTIGRRLIDLARAELNSLLDRAASTTSDSDDERDPDEDLYRRYGLNTLSDAQLEAELERRRQAREAAARAVRGGPASGAASDAGSARTGRASPRSGQTGSGAGSSAGAARAAPTGGDEIRRAYAALEVQYGSDFITVRKAYRTMMRKYHPDRHTQSPDKQKAAHELAQKLTAAYKTLDKHLRR